MAKKYPIILFLGAILMLAINGQVIAAKSPAQNTVISQNPYPVNDPMRNFYNNLNDKQKFLVRLRDDISEALTPAKKAQDGLVKIIGSGSLEEIIEAAVSAAHEQLAAAAAIANIQADDTQLNNGELQTLKEAKKMLATQLFGITMGDLNIAGRKEIAGAIGPESDGLEQIDKLLRENGLGIDKAGYLVKFNEKGDAVEYELPDGYLRQKGDVVINVPFFAQAPGGGWNDTCQGAACEETALVQAYMWINGVNYTDKYGIYSDSDMLQRYGLRQILAMCDYEYDNFPSHLYHDTSINDTAKLWQGFYGRPSKVIENPTAGRLKRGIDAGHTYVVPINGEKILTSLPYSDPAKLPAHSILLVGYNEARGEFIVNDPGTWRGQGWRFNQEDLMAAIRDYPSGNEAPVTKTDMRVLELPAR